MTAPFKKIFVTGIGTEIGKTISSAVLTAHFKADYWKPVQSGDLADSDSIKIKKLVPHSKIHTERYRLQRAASPHQSAAEEHIQIQLEDFQLPYTENNLIVEGAGGLFVPLSEKLYIIDLIAHLGLPVALVISDYLGCINHSLLSIEALQRRGLPLDYIILNGEFNPYTQAAILEQVPEQCSIFQIPRFEEINADTIQKTTLQNIKNR